MVEPNEVTYLAKTEWTIQTEDKIFLPSRIVLVIWNKGNLDEYVRSKRRMEQPTSVMGLMGFILRTFFLLSNVK